MTLCIGAACRSEQGKPQLVFCSDHKIGNWAAQAEIGFKFRWVTYNWPALIAGDLARAEELTTTFKTCLSKVDLSPSNMFDAMKAAGSAFREKLAEELVMKKLSVPYSYLRQNKSRFPSATVYDIYTQIGQIDSEAELIMGGFLDEQGVIFVVGRDCSVSFREHFAAIGTGAQVAEPALFQREQQKYNGLEETIYHTYEAKRLGEIADTVGKKTSIIIFSQAEKPEEPVQLKTVTPEGFTILERKYQELGLKPSKGITFPPEALHTV